MKSFNEFKEEQDIGSNTKAAKERISRERNNDSVKFDRILDRAKVQDARVKAMSTKPKKIKEEVKSYTMQPDLDRWLNRIVDKQKYKKAIRFYLDLRRTMPGKARQNALTATKVTGTDFRNFELVFHQMIRDGKLPKHLAWNKQMIKKEVKTSLLQKVKNILK